MTIVARMGFHAPKGLRAVLSFTLLMSAIGFGSWALLPEPTAQAATSLDKTPHAEIRMVGMVIDQDVSLSAQADAVARSYLREPLALLTPNGTRITHSRRSWGAQVDMPELVRMLLAAKDPSSLMRRVHARRASGSPLSLTLPMSLDVGAAEAELSALKDDIDQRPVEARMDTESREPRPHQDGVTVDVWGTVEALEAAIEAGAPEVALAVEVHRARRTAEELVGVSMAAELAHFETRYDASFRAENRSFNLGVAAEKIDGLVVLPGERFDFNALVGERSEGNGFRVAPVIAAGEVVDGIGGGTCQISGTLHAAVFFAGLPVAERRPHSRPSSYIKLGLDAAVSYPNLNFQFDNDRDFPIVVGFTVSGGIARATLWGSDNDLQVSFVRRVDETLAFAEREVDDPDLPRGARVLSQRGVPGFELTRWRIVRDTRSRQAVREHFEDEYPPTTQIWRVGTGATAPADYVPPPGDQHAEYTADAYLSMTVGVGIDDMVLVRRAGRTGDYGWTERAGYPGID